MTFHSTRHTIKCLFVVLCLFWPQDILAQDMPVSTDFQAKLFSKILTFDRNLQTRENKGLVIGILYQEQVRASLIIKNEFTNSLMALNGKQAFIFTCIPINIGTGKDLPKLLAQDNIDIFYVTPIRTIDIQEIAQLSQKYKKRTFTGVPEYVNLGLTVGVTIRNERPQILINLPTAKKSGANFTSQLLKISTLVK